MQIHYRSFPTNELLRWDGADTLRASFFNSLKVRHQVQNVKAPALGIPFLMCFNGLDRGDGLDGRALCVALTRYAAD